MLDLRSRLIGEATKLSIVGLSIVGVAVAAVAVVAFFRLPTVTFVVVCAAMEAAVRDERSRLPDLLRTSFSVNKDCGCIEDAAKDGRQGDNN